MRKKPLICLAVLVLCCLFPIAVNFILIMCPGGYIYTLMVYPFVLVACFPLILLEDIPAGKTAGILKRTLLTVVTLWVISNAYDTNVEYTSLYYSNRQTENYLNAMLVLIRMTEGFDTDKEWAFLGQIKDPLLRTPWQYEVRYGGNEPVESLINRGTRYDWFRHYFGYSVPMADDQIINQLWKLEEVKQMPCWPNQGSVKIIEDIIVIKCDEKNKCQYKYYLLTFIF